VTLTWTGSVDNVGVTGYDIEQNGVVVQSTGATGNQGTTRTGLNASTSYTFRVRAQDAANNESAFSAATTITTPAPVTGSLFVALTGDMCDAGTRDPATGKIAYVACSDLILNESRIHAAILCGDLQYSSGTIAEFDRDYRISYARHDDRNILTPGNHEAQSNFSGYDDWIAKHDTYVARGTAHQPGQPSQRWYAVDLPNGWVVVNLDSNVPSSSAQLAWLNNYLSNNTTGKHVIAQWHHPRWRVRDPNSNTGVAELYTALYNHRVDIVLSGHAHYYFRLPRLNPSGGRDDTRGVFPLLVGTGGHSLDVPGQTNPQTQAYIKEFGICELQLSNSSFTGTFYNPAKAVRDRLPVIPVLDRSL
jgi:hypothetical protein